MSSSKENGGVANVVIDPKIKSERGHIDGLPVTKLDKTPTLIQNKLGQYMFLHKSLADELVRKLQVVILTPADEDYLECFKKALGKWKNWGSDETIQVGGKMMKPEDIGAVDTKNLLAKAEEEVKKYKDDPKKIVVTDQMPAGNKEFQDRIKNQRFGR